MSFSQFYQPKKMDTLEILNKKTNISKGSVREFQLSDYVYTQMVQGLKLENNNVTLHCKEAGNFGDISQVYFCAALIKKARPDCNINVVIQLQTKDKKSVEAIFPVNEFNTQFLSSDYFVQEKEIKRLIESGCLVGISVGVNGPAFEKTHHRALREYGFSKHPDTKGHNLSMGLAVDEEGISIPVMTPRRLTDIQSPWLKQAFGIFDQEELKHYKSKTKLYNLYTRDWVVVCVGINSVVAIEEKNKQNIDLVTPFDFTLEEMIARKDPVHEYGQKEKIEVSSCQILDVANLRKNGIGKISRITDAGIETVSIGEGKELRIFSGQFSKQDMEAIQQNSELFFGCTGDMSFSEAVSLNKIPFYDIPNHKQVFFDSLKELAQKNHLENLVKFFDLIAQIGEKQSEIFKRHTPRKQGWYSEINYNMKDHQSVARRALIDKEFIPSMIKIADEIAQCYSNPKLYEESTKLNDYIKANYNVENKLLAIVDRGLILANYPELIEVENKIWERFDKKEISIESVFSELKSNIQLVIEHQQANKNKKI
ncbi:MAG: hypothetical protein P4M12_04405 [Gammaproteobacteria bacterium]|nr:hypothetical protein [Gammaproteobacteria bacterium]